jgi:hypothetical protein
MTTKLYFLSTAYTLAFFNTASAGNVILSLNEANARALEKHPSLAVFDAERRLADAKILSALAIPNPEIDFETEDVLGSGEYEGFQSAVYNLGSEPTHRARRKASQRAEVANVASASPKTCASRRRAAR